MGRSRKARVDDVHRFATAMPHVTRENRANGDAAAYQVGGKSFLFFRTPSPDAVDPHTGERYDDVIVFWVEGEAHKQALVQEPVSPWFTTPHFDGHASVLLRGSQISALTDEELREAVEDAWLSRASKTRARAWLDGSSSR